MKILAAIIIPPHLTASGAANAGKHLSASLANYCDVDIAILSFEKTTSSLGRAKLLARKSSNILSFTKGILPNKFRTLFYRGDIPSLIYNGDYDLVHIHNVLPALETKRVAQACVNKKTPYVISTHGFFEITSGGTAYSLKYFYEKLAWKFFIDKPFTYTIKHANRIFATSPLDYSLLNNLGIEDKRIRLVTNGVREVFHNKSSPQQIQSVCERLNLPQLSDKKVPVGIFLGNHTRNKGIEVLLEAFSQVQKPFILIVCGQKRDDIDYDIFSAKYSEHQKIIFTDWISEEDIISLFQYADLFVYPTLSDTLPLVILEAMASGLPIISTKVGGIPYQVEGNCGVLVDSGNPQAIKQAFEQITEDKQRLTVMGNAANQIVKAKFNWDRSAQKAFAFYQEMLEGFNSETFCHKPTNSNSLALHRYILGMRVDATNYRDATRKILHWAQVGKSCYICAANVHMTMTAYDELKFVRVVNQAALVTPDGMPLVWALSALGVKGSSRVYGPDLTLNVCQAAALAGIKVAFYGGTPKSLASFVIFLRQKFPSIQISCHISPPFRPLTLKEDEAYTQKIVKSGAKILFIGIGCPKQELWMAAHQERIPAVMLGVGATFDFFSGRVKQAPSWMQKLGLEWLFRLIMEPRRLWKRYAYNNPRFLLLFMLQWLKSYFGKRFCNIDSVD
jgi:exopolysaccharide biosynthesis WecB/TagA/CpsF family protein